MFWLKRSGDILWFSSSLATGICLFTHMNNELNKAKISVFRLLKFRMRSKKELKTHLERKKFRPQIITKVLTFLAESGYIDDHKFTKEWIKSRLNIKPRSKRLLHYELRQKGIEEKIIEEALASITAERETALAKAIARQRFQKIKNLPEQVIMRRLSAYLVRRGFSLHLALQLVRQLIKEPELALDDMNAYHTQYGDKNSP